MCSVDFSVCVWNLNKVLFRAYCSSIETQIVCSNNDGLDMWYAWKIQVIQNASFMANWKLESVHVTSQRRDERTALRAVWNFWILTLIYRKCLHRQPKLMWVVQLVTIFSKFYETLCEKFVGNYKPLAKKKTSKTTSTTFKLQGTFVSKLFYNLIDSLRSKAKIKISHTNSYKILKMSLLIVCTSIYHPHWAWVACGACRQSIWMVSSVEICESCLQLARNKELKRNLRFNRPIQSIFQRCVSLFTTSASDLVKRFRT